ncbi:MAG: fatty acid desaturase [Xanthomonadales bacterium]|nr:fatty acid desaturase [Xanthomonadales bacterium]
MESENLHAARGPNIVQQARSVVPDLFDRRGWLYWTDFLVTVGVSWALVALYFTLEPWSMAQLSVMLLASIGLFRAGTFIHEIVHFRHGEMLPFKWAWNLLLGFPILSPWVIYRNHIEHHTQEHYGTPSDGEYLPLAAAPPSETLKYLIQIPLLAPLAVIRFGLLGPISHLSPTLREWLLTRASAAITNPYYRKRFPRHLEPELNRSEWFCFGWLGLLTGLTLFGPMQPVHWLMAWALLTLTVGLNWVRNLAAHGYANNGNQMKKSGQVEDSINITGQTWLTLWLFPVGLRYHALHHLLPDLPYHQLGRAHRRLVTHLPSEHPYHRCNRDSYFSVIGELLAGAWKSRRRRDVISRWQARS